MIMLPGIELSSESDASLSVRDIINVLDCYPEPVFLVNDDLVVAGMNNAAIIRYGTNLTDQSLFVVIRQPDALSCIRQARSENRMKDVIISEIIHGTECKLRLVAKPLNVQFPEFGGLVLTLSDITFTSEAEVARKEFVANVSHELKSPLTTIIGTIDTFMQDPDMDAKTRNGFMAIMREEASHMSRLVSELLSLSKVEAVESIHPTSQVDLCKLVTETVASFGPLSGETGSDINVSNCTGSAVVTGDEDQLKRVVANLIDNALKYSPPGSPIEVKCFRPDPEDNGTDCISIEVADQGPGIAPEHIPRLTERFYRVDDHRSRHLGGTGLGLAIVKHILNRHRGLMTIESEPGIGSTFTVQVPMSIEPRSGHEDPG